MRIVSAGSAFPENVYQQDEITAALREEWRPRLERPAVLERLHSHCGVERRHLALPLEAYEHISTWGRANDLWIDSAQTLGRDAICRAITPLGIMPGDIDALYFVSVTGVASPSIDARLVNRMGLSRHVKRIPIFGLGCVAGAAGLARAVDYVRGFPTHIAVVLSVELCSLTWQRDDLTMANMIATGLFGDGAAAVLVAGRETEFPGPEVLATRSIFYPATEDVMGWQVSEAGFHVVLSPDIPKVIRENLGADVDSFLGEHCLRRSDIASWIIHSGGPKVLEAVEDTLNLPTGALDLSWRCLKQVGNLSSASVLVVLEEVLARRRGKPGTYSLLAAMGPGFCSELLLLRW